MIAAVNHWADVSAARLPAAGLTALAAVRCRSDITVHQSGEVIWVHWPVGDDAVLDCLRPIPGVEFFAQRRGRWFPFGRRLPVGDVPTDGVALDHVLHPAPICITPPPDKFSSPVRLSLVRGGAAGPATALLCDAERLANWADAATTAELGAVHAARCGQRALLRGIRLPSVPLSTRFHGDRALIPVGYRSEPDLPEEWLCDFCGAKPDELVLFETGAVQIISQHVFEPLTRAGLRLAVGTP